ncbi:signal recognition particle receptor subunit alpha [Candidatus Marsarchaeota archaeon]|nr:signal recognition particle receptor subunit alpha [Candidatus Marsarchaeota archaeon]MCL5089869.1 signal recognition particle receptor subunit alpha [Candidatus Marsarchaeota archaeon]
MDLGEGLRQAIARIKNATIIDAKTIREFNKELQKALLSADVDVKLVLKFTKEIEDKALKSNPPEGIAPRDYITNLVYEALVELMGSTFTPELKPKKILLMGLYGSGKTTTAAKLAKFYQDRGLSSVLVCCDVSRPAAYEQLETLSKQANVAFFGIKGEKDPAKIIKEAAQKYKDRKVLICDTSGRSALDAVLIDELKRVAKAFAPDERILVIGADIGQVAGAQAKEFSNAVDISGVIVTRMDGSARGGGALSAAHAANTKIMFIGTGEKLGNIEAYDSGKFIGRLLGIPDIISLVDTVQQAIKEAGLEEGEMQFDELNFESFYAQLKAMGKMGPLKNLLGMVGVMDVPKDMVEQSEDKLKSYKVIIGSMTRDERKNEKLLHNPSRISRIAKGSGKTEKDIHQLITDFNKMKKMFNMMKNDRGMMKKFGKFMK